MSSRSLEQLAARVLRTGLEVFWPEPAYWAYRTFLKPVIYPSGAISGYKARCITQMISDSVVAVFGSEWNDGGRRVWDIAGRAVLKAAHVATSGSDRLVSHLVQLNDRDDMTYERMRAYVEAAVLELEKAE